MSLATSDPGHWMEGAGPLVVELGSVGDADGKDGVDEPDGDQFEVIAERVVEVERRLGVAR